MNNIRSLNYDLSPQYQEDYLDLDDIPNQKFTLRPIFSGHEFKRIINYPIIVESWGKKSHGKQKREWLKIFSENERKLITSYHTLFYKWYLVSGHPKKISLQLKTVYLLKRAVAFFAFI